MKILKKETLVPFIDFFVVNVLDILKNSWKIFEIIYFSMLNVFI
jgi:hypothetical protein